MSGINRLLSEDERLENTTSRNKDSPGHNIDLENYEDLSLYDFAVEKVEDASNYFEPVNQELHGQRELFEGQDGYLLIDSLGEDTISIHYGEEQNLNDLVREPEIKEEVESTLEARMYISKASQLDSSHI